MAVHIPHPALITPAPTLPPAALGAIELRQLNTDYTVDLDCPGITNVLSCSNLIDSCLLQLDTSTIGASATSCLCSNGLPFLDCYISAVGTCDGLGVSDWNSYEQDWFRTNCGTIPPNLQAQLTAPSTVSLDFESVTIVTLNSTVTPTPHTSPPLFTGIGSLLGGDCKSTLFTLVDEGNTVYWAAFVGCNSDKPECCPWTAATIPIPVTITAATTVTITTVVGGTLEPGAGQNTLGAYPVPQDGISVLPKCADDYYSISEGCCPNGYWPFTRMVGGQTPCWSSLNRVATAPTLTAGIAGQPTDTEKPTSAVVNVVWAMQYPVSGGGGGLSKGAIAGISVGAAVAGILIGVLGFFLWRSRRKNKQLQGQQPTAQVQQQVPPGMQQQQAAYAYPGDGRVSTISTSTTPPSMLMAQTTGTSGAGTVSELSSTNTGAALVPPGTMAPANGHAGYPTTIAEADEGQHYQPQQQMYGQPVGAQPQHQVYGQGMPQGGYFAPAPVPGQQTQAAWAPPQQGTPMYPAQQQQQPGMYYVPNQMAAQQPQYYTVQQQQVYQQPHQQQHQPVHSPVEMAAGTSPGPSPGMMQTPPYAGNNPAVPSPQHPPPQQYQ